MRALVLCLFITACAIEAPSLPATHPANPSAPVGRLAGPPATLRLGVVSYPDVPVTRTAEPPAQHHHHGS